MNNHNYYITFRLILGGIVSSLAIRFLFILIYGLSLFIFFSINSFAATALPDSSYKQVHKLYQDLQKLPFDPAKIATVEDLTYAKDRAKFLFKKGMFYFAQPVAGKITAAVFSGEGLFELKPPTEIERAQVRRFLDKDSLRESFSTAYLRFSDETAHELIAQLDLQRGDIPPEVHSIHEKISKVLLEDRGFNLASRILVDILNKSEAGLFLAVLQHEQPKLNFPNYYIFQYDAQVREEVSAYQYFPYRVNKPFYTLCSFQQLSEYTRGLTQFEENKDALQINHYKMNLELERNGKITAKVAMTYTPLLDSLQYLAFDLNQELKIDSVKNSVGDSLFFIQEKKETSFSVMLKEGLPSQKPATIIVYYSGKVLDLFGPNLFLKDKFYWFPRYGYLVPATYDLTFTYPRNWQVISIGEKVKSGQSDNQAFSTWVQEMPSLTAAFALGKFDSTTYDIAGSLPIKIYSTYEHSKSMREKIAGDVANSYFVFQNLLGINPSTHLNVVENPSRTSYSFPGILLLSSLTYSQELKGVMEALRGHEVSHQWWGNWVGWKTYHDQWLSEGLAEYSGAMIAQLILDGDKTFFQILEGWRNDLLEQGHIGVSAGLRRFGFSKSDLVKSQGLKAGPIWLGRRLGEKFPVDYYLITYEKGAYVIHMLRTLLRDFETNSDVKFWHMLADFAQSYKEQRATTQDFKNIVAKHAGQNMDWFFDQWIYGTEVPTYLYSYKVNRGQSEYWIDLSVKQEDVSADFKMFIPVAVEFADKEKKTRLIWMRGLEKSFRLGPFNAQPGKVIFNDFAGILARVKLK